MFTKNLVAGLMTALAWTLMLPAARADDKFWVEVTVKEFAFLGRMSEMPDPYACFDIAGNKLNTKPLDDKKTARPNWSFGTIVDGSKLAGRDGVRVAMALNDKDSISGDDKLDINPAPKRKALEMVLRLDLNSAIGTVAGDLQKEDKRTVATLKRHRTHGWQTDRVSVTGAGDDNRARIDFTVEVTLLKKTFLNVPTDQPQNDAWSCGPNSISRVLRFYGIDASYSKVRTFTKYDGNLVSLAGVGAPPSAIIDAFKNYRRDARREDESRINRVIDLLQEGKPVVVLISTRKKDRGILGNIGNMHYLVINGYDPATDSFDFTNTSGRRGIWTRAEFEDRWNWPKHFTGIVGEAAQGALEALGLRKRTLFY